MLNFPLWKKLFVGAVCLLGVVYAAPNFLPEGTLGQGTSGLPGKQINLGLDLQGGAHLLYKVDVEGYIQKQLESAVDEARQILRKSRMPYQGLGISGEGISVTMKKPEQASEARTLLSDIDRRLQITTGETGLVTMVLTDQDRKAAIDEAIETSIEVIRQRIDPEGTKEPVIQRQGEDRILVQVPGAEDTEQVKIWIGTTAQMNFRMIDAKNSLSEAMNGRVPPGSELLESYERREDGSPVQSYLVEKRIRVEGDHLTNAQASFDQNNRPAVSFQFDAAGGAKFAKVTADNVGLPFAVVLDNRVITAPVIRSAIPGGSGIITGNFTLQETQNLSLLLRSGALPADMTVLEERSVGPGLGQDSVEAGQWASIIGLILVLVYMVMSYGLFGLLANCALIFNVALIIAILSGLQATLTLPGIAGIVLTIGMAVDANVLIFERIREEMRNGRTSANAIEAGYSRALTTIIDSNLTTLIAAVLLFTFGSGPIKGFAVTLSVGIVTSMFTAIMVTRFFVVTWYMRKRPKALPI
ncbi:protein translocase subunit SecD [Aestuariispira insulae]|uniref:Protein translocase subunit SecD n=1 Tax=Aestuariispira insulae TaxID=1461337 RepID=A0A3D9HNR3_9PROT|nr:protein translocase subunit SecD [Aestuariispira insulae]RED51045.1 preprotein translocase subunit SecD [Aestuariispira insulae]